jgi:hypothetical protein
VHPVLSYIGFCIYLTQTVSHVLTACLNPGIPSRENYITTHVKEKEIDMGKREGYKICKHCNIIVHERYNVSHCDECALCCEGKYINLFNIF